MSDLDFELDIDARMAGAADAVTQLDRFEKQFKSAKDELDSLEKSFGDTDKSLEKLAEKLSDTRIEMQRAMQAGDDKKFWKLAQTTDDLTKKEEALRKKSGELKTAIDAQQKATTAAADKVGAATIAEKKHKDAGDALDKRTTAAKSLFDRYGGSLATTTGKITSATEQVTAMTGDLGFAGSASLVAAGGLAVVAIAAVAVSSAFLAAGVAVYKYAVEQANAKRNTEQTLRALTQNNEAAKAAIGSFEDIGHATGASDDALLGYSRGLTETRRQMGLAQASTKDYQTVLRAAATASSALEDQAAGQAIIDQFNAGLLTADQLADRVDKKYGDVVKQKMLGLGQQATTLERNLAGITEHFDVKPVLEGLSRMVELTDKNTASGKFLQDIFDTVFGRSSGSLVEDFFVGFERSIIKTEIVITESEIYFFRFRNYVEDATDIDLGPFGNLRDRISDVGDVMGKAAENAVSYLNPITAIEAVHDDIAASSKKLAAALLDVKAALNPQEMEKLAGDFIDGFVSGLDKGIKRVEDKVKGVGGAAIKAMKSVLDSHSPSRVFADIGLTIPEGLEQGIDTGAMSVGQSIDALVAPPEVPQANANAETASGSSNAGGPRIVVEHLEINGVTGAEDAIDKLEEMLVTIWERRGLQMGIDAETAGAT